MSRPAGSAKLLRAINSSATLAHLLQAGRLTRAELRQRTGLSKPTSSQMLRLLTDVGLAVVTGRTAGGVGPPAEIYAPNADAAYALAISIRDTTGSDRLGLATALCDLGGTMRHRAESRIDFAAVTPTQAVSRAVTEACGRAAVDPQRLRHVQIGVAGSYDPRTDRLHHVEVPGWAQPGILAGIRAGLELPGTVVALENDVKLAAVAERHRGAAAGVESFCLLWLGGGVGLATDLGATLLRGWRGGAGEIGYLPLRGGQGPDWTGGSGQLHDLLGGAAVRALAAEYGIDAPTPAQVLSTKDERVFEALARRIAVALATIVAVIDPPLVVLAGEVALAGGDALRDAVVATLAQPHPFTGLTDTDVRIAVTAVDDDAALLGGLDAGLTALRESLISSLQQAR